MSAYKLPKCWLGQEMDTPTGKRAITAAEINPKCHCANELQAFMCMEGHLTECHAGMACGKAECAHYQAELTAESDLD